MVTSRTLVERKADIPSAPFYPAFAYELDTDGSDSADFRIVVVSNRGLSGVIYRIKVARVCSKQGRRNAWGARPQDKAATTDQQRSSQARWTKVANLQQSKLGRISVKPWPSRVEAASFWSKQQQRA